MEKPRAKFPKRPLGERLARFSAAPDANGCVLWTGAQIGSGYGRLLWCGKSRLAHRLSWSLANGPIPDGFNVLHKCDVRHCINPEHLFLGTQAENIADMAAKGRMADRRGAANGSARLTADQVRAIRSDARIQREVAAEYGITQVSVSQIKRRQTWGHVDG